MLTGAVKRRATPAEVEVWLVSCCTAALWAEPAAQPGLIFTLVASEQALLCEQLTASRRRRHGAHPCSCLSTDPVKETCPLIR